MVFDVYSCVLWVHSLGIQTQIQVLTNSWTCTYYNMLLRTYVYSHRLSIELYQPSANKQICAFAMPTIMVGPLEPLLSYFSFNSSKLYSYRAVLEVLCFSSMNCVPEATALLHLYSSSCGSTSFTTASAAVS